MYQCTLLELGQNPYKNKIQAYCGKIPASGLSIWLD